MAGWLYFKPGCAVLTWELRARRMEGEGKVIFLVAAEWLLQIPDMGHSSILWCLPCVICPEVPGAGEV